jgi:hypothetical protein
MYSSTNLLSDNNDEYNDIDTQINMSIFTNNNIREND